MSVWGSGRGRRMVAAVAVVGAPPIVPAVIESKRRGVGWHCVHSPSEEGGY